MRRIISSVVINIIAFLLRAKVFLLRICSSLASSVERQTKWIFDVIRDLWRVARSHHAHCTTFDLVPRFLSLGTRFLYILPVVIFSLKHRTRERAYHWIVGERNDIFLFTSMHQFLKLYFYTLVRISRKIFDKWVRSVRMSPLFRNNDSSTNHFQVSDSGYVSNSEQRRNNLSFDFRCKHWI